MRRFAITIFALLIAVGSSAQTFKVCTFNIKYENPKEGVHQWDNRKDQILNFIQIEELDVFGMQEVLHSQIEFLECNLLEYGRLGVARDDGKTKGEYSPIFYKKNRFSILESGTFWLSPNPEIPAKAWDAALPRVCTWARLADLESKDTVLFLNTHFDHVGKAARSNSVDLILSKIQELNQSGKVILMGDFNLESQSEPIKKVLSTQLHDAFETKLNLGPVGTYNGFKIGENYNRRIDYVFYKGFTSKSYKNCSLRIQDTFLSDHFPVVVVFE
ncbi:endonuclease/exonuclease/phosphatase family protein [Marivirga harenae]|uniref:endonuclease/exonuclease/phosphatase family protein n=1 Tax=Marivirga harenae TaxID=2010992 RepID=UPI0026E06ED0|nr:endonuclease/exonuclease/phosphatase family protein [Marivirga harenae]WKV13825.1 endonuclease/exonuclease/phosphatase family protein [Marivirga harenae]